MSQHSLETPPDVPGYEIIRLIGLGGMGEVYLADQRVFNRAVAIKLLSRTAADLTVEREQRFRREVEMMAQVSHPNVLTIFDSGTAGGRHYLVMEYVQAGDLRSRMVPGLPMEIAEVRSILGPVFRAVGHLHRAGIVHRDIKPENILMHEGVPKVTDFGIAAFADGFGTLTRTGDSFGTPGYVAPEQQYRLKVDERVDQFSLAALAYEMLTGRRPLGAFASPSKLNPKLGRAVDAAILKGLSEDATERFADVEAFAEALERGLVARKVGLFAGRNLRVVAGSLLGISILGVGILTVADRGRPGVQPGTPPEGARKLTFPETCPAPPLPPQSIRTRSADIELVLVPPGEFPMGSPPGDSDARPWERPRHSVRISHGFYLGRTEVTVGQFRAFVDATKYRTTAESIGGGFRYSQKLNRWESRPEMTWRTPDGSRTALDDEPVVQISWDDAVAFCRWLSRVEGRPFRLPTEAEWEYACRAGSKTRWSSGDSPEGLDDYAWTLRNSGFRLHPVGTRKPNAFGLYDMHGSVWEWCSDWISQYSQAQSSIDPQGPLVGQERVLRGGSFDWKDVEPTRSASRIGFQPDRSYFHYGFRVCSTDGG